MTATKTNSLAKRAARPTNAVYGPKDQTFLVQCIYFYYSTSDPLPERNVQAYYVDLGRNIQDIEAEANTILDDVKRGRIKPCGWRFGDLRWRRKSYLVFVLDDPAHRLYRDDAVVFTQTNALRGGNDILAFPSYPDVSGFYCENHMDNWQAHPFGERIDAILNHPGHHAAVIMSRYTHNDSGTNMGPPIPPP